MTTPDAPMTIDGQDALIDQLVAFGWGVQHQAISREHIQALRLELDHLHEHDQLSRAGIGRGQDHQLRDDIRGDSIYWLNPAGPAQQDWLMRMEHFRQALNYSLFLGLLEFEAHFARYPAGTFYKKHVDSFRNRANRMVSTVLYLNEDWPADGGGEMVLFDEHDTDREIGRVRPEAGTLVCFLSETIPHEVLPTHHSRASIAGWFRRNASQGGRIDPAH
ncbi:2OG-Fe(II) oxygenase [Larsenimonas rhizosphaerae]|uniref:2OG-Fe(II) oxygenase n=1 Tax=Larsenimonas rhizosphaerae TaxID=2944682 RepID=A0AA41ZGJ6_9GAMM|nr:2OG-Fe(II) oxygenase [Larsenimonas rhizosphaerae]MCX2524882.1 2OG-Fe(II) oxygenase [Larsenimonas rhizosphaerae]